MSALKSLEAIKACIPTPAVLRIDALDPFLPEDVKASIAFKAQQRIDLLRAWSSTLASGGDFQDENMVTLGKNLSIKPLLLPGRKFEDQLYAKLLRRMP